MEFKGTKGEWVITIPKSSNGYVYIGKHKNDCRIATCYTVDDINEEQIVTQETKANAQLIAAAPELLEVLLDLENDNNTIPKSIWDKRQKAINKALGL